jgi:hypothetical protein
MAELPEPGHAVEGQVFEIKKTCNHDRFELAKDIASLANSRGGVILVGAVRDGERLGRYEPLSQSDVSAAHRSYDESVRDRCRPAPSYVIEHVARDGGFVLRVKVDPHYGGLVGVQVKSGEAKCGPSEYQPENLFFYPQRVGAHTKGLLPEQIPMLIDAKLRRIAAQLENARGQSIAIVSRSKTPNVWADAAMLEQVSLEENAVHLLFGPFGKQTAVSVPLDCIETAWKDSTGWYIAIAGVIETVDWKSGVAPQRLMAIKMLFSPQVQR